MKSEFLCLMTWAHFFYYLNNKKNDDYEFVECKVKEIKIPIINNVDDDDIYYKIDRAQLILNTAIGELSIPNNEIEFLLFAKPCCDVPNNRISLFELGMFKKVSELLKQNKENNLELNRLIDKGKYQKTCFRWNGVKSCRIFRASSKDYFVFNEYLEDFANPLSENEYPTIEDCIKNNTPNIIRFK